MRIWDLEPAVLCRQHLLGEHSELHAVWSILTNGKRGFRRHPEVIRWQGALRGLWERHERLVVEMEQRGYRHASPLDRRRARGEREPAGYVDPPHRQRELLRGRNCDCQV